MTRWFSRPCVFLTVLACVPRLCLADLSFTAPASNTTVAPCKDYFTSEWGTPLIMSDRESGVLYDIAPLNIQDFSAPSYSDGILSLTASGNDPYIHLTAGFDSSGAILTQRNTRWGNIHPIDGTQYKILSFRMYSSAAGDYQVYWNKQSDDGSSVFGITDPQDTKSGWAGYTID